MFSNVLKELDIIMKSEERRFEENNHYQTLDTFYSAVGACLIRTIVEICVN